MTTSSPTVSYPRTVFHRVIGLANDKGGVGKTSLAANLAGQYAAAGYRVLLIDVNIQANLAEDLGYRDTDIDDEGAGLVAALISGLPLQPAKSVRENLDVVPGGERLEELVAVLAARSVSNPVKAKTALRDSLAPIAHHYDLIIIDSPPESKWLCNLVLCVARWIIIPTKSDIGGLRGMRLVAERFGPAREVNPDLELLGVVLFSTGSTATAIHRRVREAVEQAFGGHSPMLEATIRHSERVGSDMRLLGKLAHELEIAAQNQPPFWQALRDGKKPSLLSKTTGKVSDDYADVAAEVLQIVVAAEQAPAA
jgi:chromosome partitioning protein